MLFDEVENVLLRFDREALVSLALIFLLTKFGNGPPEIVDLLLQMLFTILLSPAFFLCGNRIGALVAIHAVVHQRVAGIEQILDRVDTVALFALGDVLLGEHQVIDDRAGVGPGAEEVIAFEKAVMAVAGMGDHQRLHGDGVFFHEIGDTGIRVDHDLVRQAHLAAGVGFLRAEEMLAV